MNEAPVEPAPFTNYWEDKIVKKRFIRMFEDVYDLLLTSGCHPFLCYGSLLGCARDNKIIPWDGDIDICLDTCHLSEFDPTPTIEKMGYKTILDNALNFKIFSPDSQPTKKPFNWPWIDVDFYRREGGKVRFLDNANREYEAFEMEPVFPLKTSEFEGVEVLIPNKTEEILDRIYPNWKSEYHSPVVNQQLAGHLGPDGKSYVGGEEASTIYKEKIIKEDYAI